MQVKDIVEVTIMNPDENNKIRAQFKCRVIEVNTSHFRAEPLSVIDHRFDRDWFPIYGSRFTKIHNETEVSIRSKPVMDLFSRLKMAIAAGVAKWEVNVMNGVTTFVYIKR